MSRKELRSLRYLGVVEQKHDLKEDEEYGRARLDQFDDAVVRHRHERRYQYRLEHDATGAENYKIKLKTNFHRTKYKCKHAFQTTFYVPDLSQFTRYSQLKCA